ncbi:BgtE-5584 [Blumeria graminis f. sp. tritici]|uniref:BgtE-5584 n=2 Tax=Blumeria graminis f. sp. tritici TaxID=62690 RepID=A0A381LBP0_BLUGR|nr:putative secreted effector protein [Blumeria graminis f. sp. tritici 96224]VDB94633.1 BgtE-5584 [Blumeria graminis f. sp. tritici]
MSCVIAILTSITGRMVILGADSVSTSYDVYETSYPAKFPQLSPEFDIFHNYPTITTPGTYHASYCSYEKNYALIIEKITVGLPKITRYPMVSSSRDAEAETSCLDYIESNYPLDFILLMSDIKKKSCCTTRVVASLAFKRFIGVDGFYGCFAPHIEDQYFRVTADEPIPVEDILSDDPLLHVQRVKTGQEALTWYQGHLHLLRSIKSRKIWWYPATKIGAENENVRMIMDFMRRHFSQIRDFETRFIDAPSKGPKMKSASSHESSDLDQEPRSSTNVQKLNENMLVASPADGWFCYKAQHEPVTISLPRVGANSHQTQSILRSRKVFTKAIEQIHLFGGAFNHGRNSGKLMRSILDIGVV